MLKKITLSTYVFLLTICFAFAQKGKVNINKQLPNWLQKVNVINNKPVYKNIQDGYFIFLIEKQNNLETNEQYAHYIREISNSSGVQNGSEISVSYDPSYEKLVFHKLIIWRDNKPMDKLSLQNFKILQNEKELSRFIYSGIFTAYLILDDIRKGDRIEYAYTIKGKNPVFPKYANTIYFEGNSQIVNVYNNIIFNPKRAIKTKNFNGVPTMKQSVVNGLNVLEWQNSMSKTYPNQDFEPSDYDPFARVQISEYQSWKEIVDWGLSLQKFELKNSAIIKEKVAELKQKSSGDKKKYFELATRFVQDEIRYMGIEIGEYSHRPNTPDKILRQRYGDCKDKSTLLCYLLRANGIEANSVFVNIYLKHSISDLLPSPSIFNHETLVVNFDDRKIFIDPTVADQRGPILNTYYPYDTKVLIIKEGGNVLETTPSPMLGKLKSSSIFKVGDTTSKSKTTLTITSQYSNNYADNYRSDLSSDGADEMEKSYLKYYTNIYPGLTISAPLEIKDNEKENIITVIEKYEIENFWTKDDADKNRRLVYFYGDLVNDQVISLKKYRNAPMYLKFPSTIEQQVKIILPEIWDFENDNFNIDNDYYRFIYSVSSKLDTLTLSYYYQNFKSAIPASAIETYIKDKKQIINAISYGIYWNESNNSNSIKSGLNGRLIALAFLIVMITSFIFAFIYTRKTTFNLDAVKNGWKIGGWLVLPAIGITLSPFLIIVSTFKQEIFSTLAWQNIQASNHAWLLSSAIIFTIVFNAILFVSSIFILISFYNRRDFFPKFYIGYLIFAFLITLTDTLLSAQISNSVNNISLLPAEYFSTIRIGIFGTVWIIYFLKSERVKQTFVLSYPSWAWRNAIIKDLNDNFGRENFGEQQIEIPSDSQNLDKPENEGF